MNTDCSQGLWCSAARWGLTIFNAWVSCLFVFCWSARGVEWSLFSVQWGKPFNHLQVCVCEYLSLYTHSWTQGVSRSDRGHLGWVNREACGLFLTFSSNKSQTNTWLHIWKGLSQKNPSFDAVVVGFQRPRCSWVHVKRNSSVRKAKPFGNTSS